MHTRSLSAAVVGLVVACAAHAGASYPGYSGEVGIGYSRSDLGYTAIGTMLSFVYHAQHVELNGRYPHQLQPLAQRVTRVEFGYGAMDYEDLPLGAGTTDHQATQYSVSAVDYAHMDLGLSATFFHSGLSEDVSQEAWTFGAILNDFPGMIVSVDYSSATTRGVGGYEYEAWTPAVGGYLPGVRLWWQASMTSRWGDGEDFSTVQAAAMLYLGDALGVGAAMTTTDFEDSDDETWLGVSLGLMNEHYSFFAEASQETQQGDNTMFSVTVGYRY